MAADLGYFWLLCYDNMIQLSLLDDSFLCYWSVSFISDFLLLHLSFCLFNEKYSSWLWYFCHYMVLWYIYFKKARKRYPLTSKWSVILLCWVYCLWFYALLCLVSFFSCLLLPPFPFLSVCHPPSPLFPLALLAALCLRQVYVRWPSHHWLGTNWLHNASVPVQLVS